MSTDIPTDAPEPTGPVQSTSEASVPYTVLSQDQALRPPGWRGALYAQWGRQKRLAALRQRYGEDFGAGDEEDDGPLGTDI